MTDAAAAASKAKTPKSSRQLIPSSELKLDPSKFELPNMEVPAALREFAEKAVAQMQGTYEKLWAAAAEATNAVEEACTTAAHGTAKCNRKAVEAACSHAETFFDFALGLLKVKSPNELVKVSSDQLSKQLDAVAEQAKEFSALAQKAVSETAEPIKTGIQRALKKVA
jgi:phasin